MILTMLQTMTQTLMKKKLSSVAFQIVETIFTKWIGYFKMLHLIFLNNRCDK